MLDQVLHRSIRLLIAVAVIAVVGATAGCSASEEDCAKGTKLSHGVCVASAAPTEGLPRVDELILKHLDIGEEGVRPLYVMHPMTVTLGLEISGEPFKSDVIIGLSSADGKRHCAAGYMELSFAGGADAGLKPSKAGAKDTATAPVASSRGEVTLHETLFVQPGCEKLAGEKKAKVWVAIDPFRRLHFSADKRLGGAPEPTTLAEIDEFLYASRWPLGFCTSSFTAGHPGNCKSRLDVRKTPGLDVRMEMMQPSSSVLTIDKEEASLGEYDRDAHLFANATSVTYGASFKKLLKPYEKTGNSAADNTDNTDNTGEDGVDFANQQLNFFFMLRPSVSYGDLPDGVTATAVDWEPLSIIEKGTVKAENGNPKLQQLLQQFLSSLETAVRRQLDVPLRLPDALVHRVTTGNWRRFSKFELLGCVAPDFKEAVAEGLSKNNNCKIVPVIIARHEFAASPLGGHHEEYVVIPGGGAEAAEFEWAEDAKAKVNQCLTSGEYRPKCVVLGEHKEPRHCYEIPEYKVNALDPDPECHCCYPSNAFLPFLSFQHEPEIGFTLGSNESLGIRTRVWWTTHMHNKSLFESAPMKVRSTVGFDATLVGWWTRGLLYVDMPIQLGIQPGIQSYWWPELAVLGFTLWDQKYVIDEDDPLFEVPVIASKEWTQNFCQTFCVQIVCFDVCAQIGAAVQLKPSVQVNEAKKSISGTLQPIAAAIAGGSVGLNLFLGVVGIKVVFDRFIAFGTPIVLESQFVVEKTSDPLTVRINGKAQYMLQLDVLRGSVSGFWTPKWGGGDQELDLYEWDGLEYIWSLWLKKRSWKIEM